MYTYEKYEKISLIENQFHLIESADIRGTIDRLIKLNSPWNTRYLIGLAKEKY